ncbi:hypothetical protein [Nocardioides sp. WS12]|uniref:hypothetical protein n=1 Tax=Nocardioides sp. WS12 TaxID=2486272 RepID=UPI0015F9DD7E|nr:hypothetical protein [Nocardioides sp. WS12]
MKRPPNPRRRLRRVLLVAGIVPTLLVLAWCLKVGLTLQNNAAGRDAFDDRDLDAAVAEFADNQRFNWFEPWIASFNEGAALYVDGAWPDSITAYESALEDVPHRDECTVRINLALVHESVGDTAYVAKKTDEAILAWRAGIDALADGSCLTDAGRGEEQSDDAVTVDDRLRNKIQETQPQEPPPQDPQQPDDEDGGDDDGKKDPRQERLERNNQEGLDQRRGEQELYDDDYNRPNSW